MRKRQLMKVEAAFDNEEPDSQEQLDLKDRNAATDSYLKTLKLIRKTVRSHRNHQIDDTQFPHFWNGIEKALLTPKPDRQPVWAVLSLAASALLVAASLYTIFFGKPEPVAAQSVVEELTTDIEGAHVGWYSSDEGATVFVRVVEKDIW